eukprot:3517477-Rhodomonas_salina.4
MSSNNSKFLLPGMKGKQRKDVARSGQQIESKDNQTTHFGHETKHKTKQNTHSSYRLYRRRFLQN